MRAQWHRPSDEGGYRRAAGLTAGCYARRLLSRARVERRSDGATPGGGADGERVCEHPRYSETSAPRMGLTSFRASVRAEPGLPSCYV